MKHSSIPVLVVGGLLVATVQVAGFNGWLLGMLAPTQKSTDPAQADALCGPRSLHVALNLLAIPVTMDEIISGCHVGAQGVAFRDLLRTARDQRAKAELRQLSWRELVQSATVSVLFVDGNHFVAIDSRSTSDSDKVLLYDGTRPPESMGREKLEARWKGEALVLGRGSEDKPLLFETCWKDAGFTHAERQEFRVAVTNRSPTPVGLRVAGTSCSCTSCTLTAEVIPPGATEYIEANVSMKDGKGVYQEQVRLESTNDGSVTEIWLCGGRYTERLTRDREFLGTLAPGDEFRVPVYVHDPGDLSLRLDSNSVNCELRLDGSNEPIGCLVAIQQIRNADPTVGSLAVFRIKPGDYSVTLTGRVPESALPQDLNGNLTIQTGLAHPLNVAIIALHGRVVVPLRCDPPALLVGPSRERQVASLILREKSGKPLRLEGFDYSLPEKQVEVRESQKAIKDKELTLEVCFLAGVQHEQSPVQKLTLRTSAGDIEVPVVFGQDRPANASSTP